MTIQRDADGQIILEELDSDEVVLLVEQIQQWVTETYDKWVKEYGPIEIVNLDELGEAGVQKRLDESEEHHIWANLDYNSGSQVTPIPGLTLNANGWAYLPGRDNFRDDGEHFAIMSKPWSGSPYSIEPVYIYLQSLCVFCDGSGDRDDDECPGCDGSGEIELDY